MDKKAFFLFRGALNDFLPLPIRGTWLTYVFSGQPALKDAIEAVGVPHPEVEVVMAGDKAVSLSLVLVPGLRVIVFPYDPALTWPAKVAFRSRHPLPDKFILDVHLGSLARALRLLGFDTLYENNYSDHTIASLAAAENRVVLTRDIGLLKHKAIQWGYWLRSQFLEPQLAEVLRYCDLHGPFRAFTRCLDCNGPIAPVAKEVIWELLPPKTRLYYDDFYQCQHCRKVYWKGSHYERMQQFLNRIQADHQSSFFSKALNPKGSCDDTFSFPPL